MHVFLGDDRTFFLFSPSFTVYSQIDFLIKSIGMNVHYRGLKWYQKK